MSLCEMKWRVDENGKPTSVKRTESIQVSTVYYDVILDEIPNIFNGIEIQDEEGNEYYLVEAEDKIGGRGCYVDFNYGVVTFAPSVGGKVLTFNYYGRGYKRIHSSRIVEDTKNQELPTIYENMKKMQEKIDGLNNVVNKLQCQIDFLVDELEKIIE